MKANKMIFQESIKGVILSAWRSISEKNGAKHSPNETKRLESEIDEYFNSLEFSLYWNKYIERELMDLVNQMIDQETEKINLWVDIAKKTANDPGLPWQMIVERADNVLAQYEKRFNNEKTGTDGE